MGTDLQSEHERFICEQEVNGPVVITDYPRDIKAFYMRLNDDETVAAMDVLVPGVGEIIGGSQREERLDVLDARMDAHLKEELGGIEIYVATAPSPRRFWPGFRAFGAIPHRYGKHPRRDSIPKGAK